MDGKYGKQIIAESIKLGYNLLKRTMKYRLHKVNVRRLVSVLCLCSIFGIVAANTNYAYAVALDGQVLCYAENWDELSTIVEQVEQIASEALGRDFTLEAGLSAKLAIGASETATTEKMENLLLESIPEIEYLNVISLDGKAICASEDEAAAKAALDNCLAQFTDEETLSAEFIGDVTIEAKYANIDLLADEDSLCGTLSSALEIQTHKRVTYEENVAYAVEYVDDSSLFVDETAIRTKGVSGRAVADYDVYLVNGAISQTVKESSKVVSQPVTEVIAQGTRERISTGSYIWPTEGNITSYFGYRSVSIGSSNHKGIDIADDLGTAIYAADGGEVIMAEYYYGYGRLIEIRHDNGDVTYYGHLSSMDAEVGDMVEQGAYIGAMGMSGTASGSHLHFEYHPGGKAAVDPLTILPSGQ